MAQHDETGKYLGTLVPDKKIECTGIEALRMHYQDKGQGMALVYVTGKLYRKSIWKDLKFREDIYYEDVHLMPTIMLKTKVLIYLPIIVQNYLVRSKSISHNKDNYSKLYRDSFKIWDDHLKLYRKLKMEEFEKYICFSICEKVFSHKISNSIPNQCRELSRKKVKENFFRAMSANLPIKRKILLVLRGIKSIYRS